MATVPDGGGQTDSLDAVADGIRGGQVEVGDAPDTAWGSDTAAPGDTPDSALGSDTAVPGDTVGDGWSNFDGQFEAPPVETPIANCSPLGMPPAPADLSCMDPVVDNILPFRVNLTATLPDGSNRYLHSSPSLKTYYFDHYCDSSGAKAWIQNLPCGYVSLTSNFASLSVKVDGTTYSGSGPGAKDLGSVFGVSSCFFGPSSYKGVSGPQFDAKVNGVLADSSGATISLTGTMQNKVGAGAPERLLATIDFEKSAHTVLLRKDGVLAAVGNNSVTLIDGKFKVVSSINVDYAYLGWAMLDPQDGILGAAKNGYSVTRLKPDGSLDWTHDFGGEAIGQLQYRPASAADWRTVFVVSKFGEPWRARALAPDGSVIGDVMLPGFVVGGDPIILKDGNTIVPSKAAAEYAVINPKGIVSFHKYCAGPSVADISLAATGPHGFLAGSSGALVALTTGGNVLWKISAPIGGQATVAQNGYVFGATSSGTFVADAQGQTKLIGLSGWSFSIPPVQLANGNVLLPSSAMDGITIVGEWTPVGVPVWAMQLPAVTDVAVDDQGIAYLLNNKQVFAVKANSGIAKSPWPASRGGRRKAGTSTMADGSN